MQYSFKLTILLLSLLFVSCHKSETEDLLPQRTVLFYLGGDNNLSIETYDKLKNIIAGWNQNIHGNLLIYQDSPYKEKARLLKVTGEGTNGYTVVKEYGEHNSADAEVFSSVINDVLTNYPAKSYGLVIFSHASGWLPPHTFSVRSVITDNENEMELSDLASALPSGIFHFIIFEACNMGGIEVVYELKDKADYILASTAPIVSPGFTAIYPHAISYLFEAEPNLGAFAKDYFDEWNSKSGNKQSATISLVKTAALPALADICHTISSNSSTKTDINSLQTFDGVAKAPYYFFDFEAYYKSLTGDIQLQTELNKRLKECLVYQAYTPYYSSTEGRFPISTHSGLTTYIIQDNLKDLNNAYQRLQWYQSTY